MEITSIDRNTCKFLREQLDEALSAMALPLGLTAKAGSARYDGNTVDFKVTLALAGHDANRTEFDRCCIAFGLTPEDYGKEFQFRRKTWKLVGIKIRASKYPIIAEREGKRWKLPREAVESLKKANAA